MDTKAKLKNKTKSLLSKRSVFLLIAVVLVIIGTVQYAGWGSEKLFKFQWNEGKGLMFSMGNNSLSRHFKKSSAGIESQRKDGNVTDVNRTEYRNVTGSLAQFTRVFESDKTKVSKEHESYRPT